jgi:Flp pilus assembly protein TadD
MTRLAVTAAALLTAACAHRTAPITPSAQQRNQDRQAINAIDAGDGDFEAKQLRTKLDANPLDLDTRIALARRYQALGFPEVAVEHLRLACERAPDSDAAHIALAKVFRDDKRPAEGAQALIDYTKAKPSAGASVWAWLGLLHDDAGQYKAGEAAHRKALALAPNRDDLHNNLGYCLLLQKKKKEAAEEFRAALRINPASVTATNNLAAALSEGAPKEALERLQSVADPATAHSNLAAVLIEEGRYDDARKEIETALSYNRQHPAALSNLALVSQMDGKPAEVKAGARVPEGSWARVVHTWHRLWDRNPPASNKAAQTGTTTASQRIGDQTQ